MRGPISVDDVMKDLPKARRKAIEAKGAEWIARVERRMTLAEVRRHRKLSQAGMAEALGVGQMQISRLERRRDPRLSTIQRTIAAMGGSLTLIATFPDQEPIVLMPARGTDGRPGSEAGASWTVKVGLRKQRKGGSRAA